MGIVAWLMKSLYLHFNGNLKYWRKVISFYMFACVFYNRFEVEYKFQHKKYWVVFVFVFVFDVIKQRSVSEGLESQT